MIGASKILTVSYGTFSCTLEGFDDPFNTMKAIAEYFRDLAAEDRYFGAEPPTPDAAMLHKIAEREIQRRVEAKIQENGVILRAGEASAPQQHVPAQIAAPTPLDTPLPPRTEPVAVEPVAVVAPAPVAPAPRITMPAAAATQRPAPIPATPSAAAQESVAEKLMRIRSAVAQAAAPYGEEEDVAPQAAADRLPEDLAPEPTARDLSVEDILPEELAAETDAPVTVSAQQPVEVAAAIFPETIAEVEEDTTFTAPAADFGGELAEEALEPVAEAALTPESGLDEDALIAGLALIDTAPQIEMPPEAMPAPADLAEDEALNDLLAALADDTPAHQAAEYPEPQVDLLPDLDLEPEAHPVAEAAGAWNEADPLDDALMADLLADVAPATDAAPEAATPESDAPVMPDSESRVERARARVIRIRRAPTAPAELAELAETVPDAEPVLSPEAEADLARELAELEAEHASTPAVTTPAPDLIAEAAADIEQPDPARPIRPARPVRRLRVARAETPVAPTQIEPRLPETLPGTRAATDPRTPQLEGARTEEAMTRLIAETNSQMAGPDNRRRLSAIAHLKAAVAATVAERRVGGSPAKSEDSRVEPYREDLSRIVRPSATPQAQRPAPLVLVSELRVDRDPAPRAPETVQPVRPRRVTGGSAALAAQSFDEDEDEDDDEVSIFTDAKGFAEFAERIGAEGFPALLEAAAAYAACVEGRPHFSRPQLMRQVSEQAEEEGITREDGLRYFGTLLREGRIVKVRRGQYALAETSHVLAKARKLVG
ncbi:hypothetical protein SAMN04488103_107174 [Gemmobacter aquatilis]|uniref:Lipoprotein n=1 Tax=Gemmobacter aquatilis TaxID=933059 RepID=A0A1H8J9R4_9RHOB|nr:hypothetical protein [Gemmobacter aquatilis]SEN76828.1 hypothetical protein SAMN04488103_107174 [Gemmobacter aquatilis]